MTSPALKDRYMLCAKEAPAGIIRWSKSWIAATWLVCCCRLSPMNEEVRVGGEPGERGLACLEAGPAVDVDEEARVTDELAADPAMCDMCDDMDMDK